ncbi:MAG: CHAT domain-containing protein [Bacteroidota bacterium]
MRFFGFALLLIVTSSYAQFPVSPNLLDENGKRTGHWTILYDSSFNLVHDPDSVDFYRLIRFEAGVPVGKIRDFSRSGFKYWDGYAKSIDPYVFHGESNFYHENGKLSYRQIYVEGKREGPCAEYYQNGNEKSTGQFHEDMQEGKWQYFFEDGKLQIELTFSKNDKTGPIKFYYNNGKVEEESTYKNGKLEGVSLRYNEQGNKTGLFTYKADTLNGIGENYYESGKLKDHSDYKKGYKTGPYIEYYESGATMNSGAYKNGKQVGPWTYYYEDGKVKNKGRYDDNGEETGVWEYYYQNGKMSDRGSLVDGLGEGEWITYYDDGAMKVKAQYKRDTLDGNYTLFFRNGKKQEEGLKKHGQSHGYWKIWNEQGVLINEGAFEDGKVTGLWKFYYETGELSTTAWYRDDVLHGITTKYYVSGKIKDRALYRNSNADSTYIGYYEDGKTNAIGNMKDGHRDGEWRFYFPTGILSDINTYADGKENGAFLSYYPDGKVRSESERRDGIMYGKAKFYFMNGNLDQEGSFVDGLYDGKWLSYDSASGRLTESSMFLKGKRHGARITYNEKGKETEKQYYVVGWKETVDNVRDSIDHLIRIRDFDKAFAAVKWLQAVEKRDFKDPGGRTLSISTTARIYSAMKDYPKTYDADMKYLKAVEKYEGKQSSNYKTALHNVATALHNMGKYDEALKYYDIAIETARPQGLVYNYWSTIINKVYCLYDANRASEASALLDGELENANKLYGPDSSAAWFLRYEAGDYYYDRPEIYEKAEVLLKDLVADIDAEERHNNEFWFDANYRLGQVYYNWGGRNWDAVKPFRNAAEYQERNNLTDTPSYGEILASLFYIYNTRNVLDTASARQDKIISEKLAVYAKGAYDPTTRAEAYLALGNEVYNEARYPEAFELFKKAEEGFNAAGKGQTSRQAAVLQSLAFSLMYSNRLRFAEAEGYFLKSIDIRSKLSKRNTPGFYNSLRQLSEFYLQTERYDRAAELAKEVKKIATDENDLPTIAKCNQELGEIEYNQWHYKQAMVNFKEAIAYYEQHPRDFADSYVNSLGYVSSCYKYIENFDEAVAWSKRSISTAKELFGEKSGYHYYRVSSLASIYERAGLNTESIKAYNEASAGLASVYGAESTDALTQQVRIIEIRNKMNDFKKAVESGEPLLSLIETKYTANSDLYLDLVVILSQSHDNLNQYDLAEQGFVSAVEVSRALNGANAPATAIYLSRLGKFYDRRNRFDESKQMQSEAVDIMRSSDYRNSPAIAAYLDNLANSLLKLEKNKEAEDLFNEGFTIARRDSINNVSTYVDAGLELARFYSQVGRFREAEVLIRRLSKLVEQTEGKKEYYCQTRQDLVYMYYRLGQYDEAKTEAAELLSILEEIRGQDNWLVLRIHNYLGIIHDDLSEFEDARKEFIFCIEASERKTVLTEIDQASLATYYSNVARIELCLGNYEDAGKHLTTAEEIRKKYNIRESQNNYAATLSNWASYYAATGKMDKAEATWATLNKALLEFSRNNFYFMTDEEKAQFWKSFNGYFEIFHSFAAKRFKQNPAVIADMYNVQLATKAILLSASNKIRKRILSSRDTSMVSMYYQWTRKREQLAQLYSSGAIDAKQRLTIDSLETAAQLLEKEMNISAEDLSKDKGGSAITWKNVQSTLGPDEAAVEIIRFKHYDRYWRDSVVYAAMVLTSETKQYPKFIVLNDGKHLEGRYLKYYRNSIASQNIDTLSYRQYWSQLESALKGKSRVYLSLDGVYNQINLNTLRNPRGGYLVDDKNLTILSNTKDLIAIKSRKIRRMSLSSATLFGFPTYFLGGGDKRPGGSTREVNETNISPLIGTQEEIQKVGSILQSHKIHADVFTNEQASEHAIKQLQHPRVLHIATHGFFVEDMNSALAIAAGNESDPLLRAGLLLAGAADFIQNRSRLEEENGILTAYEAANLDLDNTDLVVLSACETGKGEVENGEGVYGLQRAFQTAGAQTIVMSLWKVDDAATQQLMTSFYTNWMNGMSKAEALKSAQISLKKQFPHPYYWGAFIMLEN